jgi:putative salt-induced outer membrane protein YdiY
MRMRCIADMPSRGAFGAGLAGLASIAAGHQPLVTMQPVTAPGLGPGGVAAMQVASLNLAQAAEAEALPTTDGVSSWLGSGWKRNVDVGVNGAEGNTDNFSGRIGLGAERKAADMETKAGISYKYAQQDDEKNQSRGEAFVKNDYVWSDTSWGLYWRGQLEYDEFQAWDWRASFYVGPTYTLIKSDKVLFRGRAGMGVSQEFGGDADEEAQFEGNVGFDYENKLTERQKLFLTGDLYPSLSDWPDYRWVLSGGWEILVDPEANMSLKLGFTNRYDISPGDDKKKNDFEYFATLSWVF